MTRKTILTAAAELFSKEGIREVSVDDICRKLSISKKTFYQSYSQKEDLVEAIVSFKIEEKRKKLGKMLEGKDTVESLVALFDLVGRKKTMDSDSRMAKEIRKYYPMTFEKHLKGKSKVVHDYFMSGVDRGIVEGLVRDDIDAEGSLLLICLMHRGMVDYINEKYIYEGKKVPFKALAASFEDIITRVVLSDKGMEEYRNLKKRKQDNR